MVIVDHAYIINGQSHLLANFGGQASLGAIGVGVFFVLSGALVTGSYLNCKGALDFLIRRARRIYPGYVVCILTTALLFYPLVTYTTANGASLGLLNSQGPVNYVLKNAWIMQGQIQINDLFSRNPEAFSVNGSLWSIPWEVGCYLMVLCLGVAGVLRSHPWVVCVCLAIAFLNICISPAGSIFGKYYLAERVTYLPVLFLSGATFYLFRDKIRFSRLAATGSLALFVCCLFIEWRWAMLFLPYAMFGLAYSERVVSAALPDLSYGMYIYSFPIQQAIWHYSGDLLSIPLQILITLLLVGPISALSWYWVESPCLKRRVTAQAA